VVRKLALVAIVVLTAFALSCDGGSVWSGNPAARFGGNGDSAKTPAFSGIDFESHQVSPPRPPRPDWLPAGQGIVQDGFELIAIDKKGYPSDKILDAMNIEVETADDSTVVTVKAVEAVGMTESLFYLKYSPETHSPRSAGPGNFLGQPGEFISVFANRRGECHAGIARILPDENGGVSGSGTIAQFTFKNEPYREPAANPYTSEANEYNKVMDLAGIKTDAGITLSWTEKNIGDYDNNGEVGVPDITPIAQHYLHEKDGDGVWPDPYDELIDGDNSGDIGIADITPIAVNYLNAVVGYNIYRVLDTGGTPDFTDAVPLENPINPEAAASVVRDGILDGGEPPTYALIYSFTDATAELGVHYVYVVRPVSLPTDDPSEGLDSNIAYPEYGAEFQLRTDVDTYSIGEQIMLEVYLLDPENVFSSNARFDFDPALLAVAEDGISASPDAEHLNLFDDSVFFGVEVDENTIAFNNTGKKGQEGVTSAGGVLAYVIFDVIADGQAEFSIHDPSDFVWLRSPDVDFSINKLHHGVLNPPSNPLVVTINPE